MTFKFNTELIANSKYDANKMFLFTLYMEVISHFFV